MAKAPRTVAGLGFVRFAEQTLRLRLTKGQRILARVVFDGVEPEQLEGEERELARAIFGDVDTVPPRARRILVLVLGRRSGKTMLSAAFALYLMLTADVSAAGPGSVPMVVTIAPKRKNARQSIRMALEMARRAPDIAQLLGKPSAEGFTLRRPHDGRLVGFEALAASRGGDTARGFDIIAFILDEAQFFGSGDDYVINDHDVYRALIPALMKGGKGIFISTPWPVPTKMSEEFERNFGAPSTGLAARAPTLLMRDGNAALAENIEIERLTDPDNAAREFDCVSEVSGTGTFFDHDAIAACVSMAHKIPADPWGEAFAGADTGFKSDSSAICVVGRESGFARLLALRELQPKKGAPLKPSEVFATFAEVVQPFGCDRIGADHHYAEAAREHLDSHGLSLEALPSGIDGKAETYIETRTLIHTGRLLLPDSPRLLSQLRAVRSKPMPGGSLSIFSPRRTGIGHGDLVSALVGAVWQGRHADEQRDTRVLIVSRSTR